MVLKSATLMLLKYALTTSLAVLLLGMALNYLSEEKSSIGMLATLLGWLGSCASGAVLSTKRVLCPRCKTKWIPVRQLKEEKACRYCTG